MAKNLQAVARRALTPCAGEEAFRFADGNVARNLLDFQRVVESSSPYLIDHHRGHYHAWIHEILGDAALARRVERLSRENGVEQPEYRARLLEVLDDRIAQLRERVV